MNIKANPYVITFDDKADGGPEHLLHLLVEYGVRLYRAGVLVCEGMVKRVDWERIPSYATNTFVPEMVDEMCVTLELFESGDHAERVTRSFPVFGDAFDEVRYL